MESLKQGEPYNAVFVADHTIYADGHRLTVPGLTHSDEIVDARRAGSGWVIRFSSPDNSSTLAYWKGAGKLSPIGRSFGFDTFAVSADGTFVVVDGEPFLDPIDAPPPPTFSGREIKVYETVTGRRVGGSLPQPRGPYLYGFAGSLVLMGDADRAQAWDFRTGTLTDLGTPGPIITAANTVVLPECELAIHLPVSQEQLAQTAHTCKRKEAIQTSLSPDGLHIAVTLPHGKQKNRAGFVDPTRVFIVPVELFADKGAYEAVYPDPDAAASIRGWENNTTVLLDLFPPYADEDYAAAANVVVRCKIDTGRCERAPKPEVPGTANEVIGPPF